MKYNLLFSFLIITILANGQSTEGVIKFKHTQYFEFENMPADMPKSQTNFNKLTFNATESIYDRDADVKIEEAVAEDNRRGFMMRRMRDRTERILYTNVDKEITLEQIGFFNKEFLVSDSLAEMKWKISAGEQKEILGYTCMKAILKDTSSKQIIAFFTPQITLPLGPDKYGQLPGVILEIQSAQTHIIATEVNLGPLSKALTLPTKGDKKTRKEFEKLREEKMKEQKEMWGGGGTTIRRGN
ncbi:MAG: GLPGLI family protein [Saprospiraceae bacterium]|nr:GLPGLI family protein [Saprospiraceae bacterium]